MVAFAVVGVAREEDDVGPAVGDELKASLTSCPSRLSRVELFSSDIVGDDVGGDRAASLISLRRVGVVIRCGNYDVMNEFILVPRTSDLRSQDSGNCNKAIATLIDRTLSDYYYYSLHHCGVKNSC